MGWFRRHCLGLSVWTNSIMKFLLMGGTGKNTLRIAVLLFRLSAIPCDY